MKILGIDYGKKKIGIALGDTQSKLTQPLGVLSNREFFPRLNKNNFFGISFLEIKKIIIGNPYSYPTKEMLEFKKNLEIITGLPVEFFDETLSSKEAQKSLINSMVKKKSRRQREDAIAACVMLQYYLESCFQVNLQQEKEEE